MCSIDIWFSDSSSDESTDENAILRLRRERRRIRDRANPLEMCTKDFIANFRLSKDAFMDLLTEIDDKLQQGVRSNSIPNILKLAIALKFCALGTFQNHFDKDSSFGLAQQTVSNILKDVFNVLEKTICPQYIDFEASETEIEETQQHFKEKFGIPGVLGCIDAFHVRILNPEKKLQHLYRNKKGYCSINAMIVCDHKNIIRYINARYPGSSTEAEVFEQSKLKKHLEDCVQSDNHIGWLLGDSAYELQNYLMTPYRNAKNDTPQSKYNAMHARAMKTMENTIRILKSRFKCLSGEKALHYAPKKASQIINVCAALHNICCAFNLPVNDEYSCNESDDFNEISDCTKDSVEAETIRNKLVKSCEAFCTS